MYSKKFLSRAFAACTRDIAVSSRVGFFVTHAFTTLYCYRHSKHFHLLDLCRMVPLFHIQLDPVVCRNYQKRDTLRPSTTCWEQLLIETRSFLGLYRFINLKYNTGAPRMKRSETDQWFRILCSVNPGAYTAKYEGRIAIKPQLSLWAARRKALLCQWQISWVSFSSVNINGMIPVDSNLKDNFFSTTNVVWW